MLLLCAAVVLGAASVGVLYIPAAIAMMIATALSLWRGHTSRRAGFGAILTGWRRRVTN